MCVCVCLFVYVYPAHSILSVYFQSYSFPSVLLPALPGIHSSITQEPSSSSISVGLLDIRRHFSPSPPPSLLSSVSLSQTPPPRPSPSSPANNESSAPHVSLLSPVSSVSPLAVLVRGEVGKNHLQLANCIVRETYSLGCLQGVSRWSGGLI